MTATKTTLPAKDGTSTPYTQGMVNESVAADKTTFHYIAEPVGETIITPAQDGTDATGVTAPTGAVGIRGWLSGIFNKLSTSIAVTGTFFQATQPVSATSLPLPTGAGTSANQTTINTTLGTLAKETGGNLATVANAQGNAGTGIAQPTGGAGLLGWLSGIYSKLAGSIAVTGTFFQATQPVSAASLPLPSGAATSALQTTGNAALTTINSTLGSPMQTTGGSITANAGTNLNTSALALETGGNLASIKTNTALTAAGTSATSGQGVQGMSGGVPLPVSLASQPLPANSAQETGGNLATIGAAQGVIGTGITPPTGGSGILGLLSGIFQQMLLLVSGVNSPIPTQAQTVSIGGVGVLSQPTHTPSSASSQASNLAIAASIPATAGQWSYLSALWISGLGSTGGGTVACNITNVLATSGSNTWNFSITVPAGVTIPFTVEGGKPFVINFTPPLQAKLIDTGIQVNVGAFGAGNTQQTVSVNGYTSPSAQFVI